MKRQGGGLFRKGNLGFVFNLNGDVNNDDREAGRNGVSDGFFNFV